MFTIDDVLSEQNRADALAALRTRHDGAGPDGMRLSSLDEWHKVNGDRLVESIRNRTYVPGTAAAFETTNATGKRREVTSINVVDRLVEKMLQLQLTQHLNPTFSPSSFAYREGKGTLDAVLLARQFVEEGRPLVCEIDLKDYFSTVNLDSLMRMLEALIEDEGVLWLVRSLIHREVERHGRLERQSVGLLQGASTSPVLSNLYLDAFDKYMDGAGYHWLRFSDNIFVYEDDVDVATATITEICDLLEWEHGVVVNQRKTGVHRAIERRLLGYDLVEGVGGIEVRQHVYAPMRRHDRWYASSVYKDRDAYHLLQDGIITRKDYSLLFENEDEKHHIPVEVTSQINVYANVTVAPSALKTLSDHNIRVAYVNKYGDLMGIFVPEGHAKPAETFLMQCRVYTNPAKRLALARLLEDASIANMEANLRYYARRVNPDLADAAEYLDACQKEVAGATSVDGLRLIEARARKAYYASFARILTGTEFDFEHRTRRPPRDPGNAMISFGNTVLYNYVLQAIWRTTLDPKIGVVHATNRRSYSLNLDVADVFKPVIVDRVVFSLVNRRRISAADHFQTTEDGGVLLNTAGKRVFLEALEAKLDDVTTLGNRRVSYRRAIAFEVMALQRYVASGITYKPFKYH